MDQIQLQASKLWELIFSEETGETYQNALTLTGSIIKESAQLIWLVICSVFVFGAWFGDTSMKTGSGLRGWIEQQTNPSLAPAEDKTPLAETGKNLLATGRSGLDNLLNTAREQLGLEPVEPAPVRKPSIKPSASRPATAPKGQQTAAPSAATPSAATPSAAAPSASGPSTAAPSTAPASEPTAEISREVDDDDWPPSEVD